MVATLLHCSICPKQPTFTDTSHLLTHIGSKGHLSNLHKLQVRSYQEISASHQLTAYNQWYQQHDVGRLLSERMLQRESKRAAKRRATTPTTEIKEECAKDAEVVALDSQSFAVDPRLQQTPSTRQPGTPKAIAGTTPQPGDKRGLDLSPITLQLKRTARRSLPSLVMRSPSDTTFELAYQNPSADIDSTILGASEASKLKGVLWPGMHLFDAATAETRRERNQKKDGSVLMQMEKASKDVHPTEVIYSDGWTPIKQCPITGMVEDSSPLKNESPLPKKTVRNRRQALVEISANIPRNAKKSIKVEQPRATHRRHGARDLTNNASPSLPGSSNRTFSATRPRFSPMEHEAKEFKLTVADFGREGNGGNSTIFHDKENPNHHHHPFLNTTTEQRATGFPPLAGSQMRSHLSQAGRQIPCTTPSWLLPQYQQPQLCQNVLVTQASGNPSYYAHQPFAAGMENIESWHAITSQEEQSGSALGRNHNAVRVQNSYLACSNTGYDGQIGIPSLYSQDDELRLSANPLSAADENLQDHPKSLFKTSEPADLLVKPFAAKRDSISPDRDHL